MKDKLKKCYYIDCFGGVQEVDHYMAHYKDGCTVDVLDEDWFTLSSEEESTEYWITPSKWEKKMERKWVMSQTSQPRRMNMKESIDFIVLIKYPRTGLNSITRNEIRVFINKFVTSQLKKL